MNHLTDTLPQRAKAEPGAFTRRGWGSASAAPDWGRAAKSGSHTRWSRGIVGEDAGSRAAATGVRAVSAQAQLRRDAGARASQRGRPQPNEAAPGPR